jgi:protein-arginine kinase activator protein McsA
MSEQELIDKLDELYQLKETEISNQNYERAAEIRDEIRKYTELLEDLMNR